MLIRSGGLVGVQQSTQNGILEILEQLLKQVGNNLLTGVYAAILAASPKL